MRTAWGGMIGLMMASVERDYPMAWREYRRRSLLALVSPVVGFPGGLFLGLALVPYLGADAPPIVAVLCFVAVAVPCCWRLWRWPCPRCGQPFHGTQWYNNPFARKCEHCSLPVREPTSAP
jgi:hypothetical protein